VVTRISEEPATFIFTVEVTLPYFVRRIKSLQMERTGHIRNRAYKKHRSGDKCTENFCWKTFEETSWDIDKERW
jgi:hypothetical protein